METIKRKKKFNAETLEATTTETDDDKQNVIYDPNGNVINLADFQVKSLSAQLSVRLKLEELPRK